MNIKEHLGKIAELNAAERLSNMTDQQLEEYVKGLNVFVDTYPAKEIELRAALEKRSVEPVSKVLLDIKDILVSIGAQTLADECSNHIKIFDETKFERISSYVNFFISTMIALSIDIQMALFMDENKGIVDQALPASKGGEKIILAVDDDSFCLDILKSALMNVSCKVIGVTTSTSALNILRTQKPDLFILDIEMPNMNGIELAGKIKGMGHKEPIIFITGNADKSYVINAVKAGGRDFILKPINPQNVVARIKKFL